MDALSAGVEHRSGVSVVSLLFHGTIACLAVSCGHLFLEGSRYRFSSSASPPPSPLIVVSTYSSVVPHAALPFHFLVAPSVSFLLFAPPPPRQLNAQGRARSEIAALYNWRYKDLGNLSNVQTHPAYLTANAGFAYDFQLVDVPDFEVGVSIYVILFRHACIKFIHYS